MSDVILKHEPASCPNPWVSLYIGGDTPACKKGLFGVYDHDDTYGPRSSLRHLYVWAAQSPGWRRLDPGVPDDLNGPELERYLITLLRMNT